MIPDEEKDSERHTTGNAIEKPTLYATKIRGAVDMEFSEEAISPCVANNIDLSTLARKAPVRIHPGQYNQ